jgi:hypothetical protein
MFFSRKLGKVIPVFGDTLPTAYFGLSCKQKPRILVGNNKSTPNQCINKNKTTVSIKFLEGRLSL